jgi:hypothetical protein
MQDGTENLTDLMGAGSIVSTIDDITKGETALQSEKLLSREARPKYGNRSRSVTANCLHTDWAGAFRMCADMSSSGTPDKLPASERRSSDTSMTM